MASTSVHVKARHCARVLPTCARRRFHQSAVRCALPAVSTVEAAAARWVQSRVNPNRCSDLSNLPLSLALLQAAHRTERASQTAAASRSVVINPVSVALRLRDNRRAQRSLIDAMPRGTTAEQLDGMLHGVDHQRIAADLTAANSQFAEWKFSSPSPPTAPAPSAAAPSSLTSPNQPASFFSGYLAPRFALTKTVSPSWFIPTPTASQRSAFAESSLHSVLPYREDDTAVTPLERSVRVSARMLYRTGKLWYVEGTSHQMADVPYLHPDYSLTLLCARFTDEPSIEDHPQPAYGSLTRRRADIHSVLDTLSPQQIAHDLRYMALMPGLLVLPAFDANYTLQLGKTGDGSSGGGLSDTSRLVISGAGLQSGGLKTLSHRPDRPFPHFLMSAHRPFVFFVRHRPTNHIALLGLIEQVESDRTEYKYKTRRVQWLEDNVPIQQF